ncbi:hypothetical protein AAG906_004723 [Vitis piasezkii]
MHHFRSASISLQKQLSSTRDNAPKIGKENSSFFAGIHNGRTTEDETAMDSREDDELKHFKTEYPKLPWEEIIKLANLQDRDERVVHRWNNYLRPDINKGEFSPQEDELIIHLKSLGNRWYNHLKKRPATINDPRRPLPYHVQHLLMDDQTSDHSFSEDDTEAWVSSWITDDDLNPISSIPEHIS